ncbi:MAG TPA: 30S ribosomal protein S3 [Candidatus Dormibacteraeota bacterium]|nr:30S ribosomal protein S3 [Candidatus Dormibacteraeota bacterium]
MGHKVHPNAFRLGIYRGWEANWFASGKDYTKLLHEDLEMRRLIATRLRNAGIARIETERSSNAQMTITIHTAKPGIVIGKGGASVDQLREDLEKQFGNRVRLSIQEIKQPELDAQLVAENIASQLERRISHRRAMKQSILRTMRAGAKGVRIELSGRLRGAEMARREWDREGRVPLHTLRADIQFGQATAKTTFGVIGVKVWIYRGDVSPRRVEQATEPTAEVTTGEQTALPGGRAESTAAGQGAGQGQQPGGQRRRRRGSRGGQGGAGQPRGQHGRQGTGGSHAQGSHSEATRDRALPSDERGGAAPGDRGVAPPAGGQGEAPVPETGQEGSGNAPA